MTEKEKLVRAKKYMDYLSRGFNPLDEEPVKNDDIIRNERISRCLMYVSEVLTEVIEKGIAEKNKDERIRHGKKEEFYLPMESREKFLTSEAPLTCADIAARLSELRDESKYKVLHGITITEYLASKGFLEEKITVEGKSFYNVTKDGEALGIFAEKRISQNNAVYFITRLTCSAQQFVVDNLDEIIEYNKVRKIMRDAKKQERREIKKFGKYSIADEIISDLHSAGATVDEIAYSTDLEKDTVLMRMKALGLV